MRPLKEQSQPGSSLLKKFLKPILGGISSALLPLVLTACNPNGETTIGIEFHPNVDISYTKSILAVSNAQVSSGNSIKVTLSLNDLNGQFYISNLPIVSFSATGGTSTGTFSTVVNNGDSTYTANFTGVTAGTATTISALVNGKLLESTLPTVTVVSGAVSLSQSIVSVGASSVFSGASTTVTLTAKDMLGNRLSSGGLTVAFSISGGTSTGTFSSVTDHGDGTYTSAFTGATAGTATTINATIGGNSVTSTLPTIIVASNTTATQVVISSGDPQTGTAGTALGSPFVVSAEDGSGNAVSGATIDWVVTSGGGTLSASSSISNGSGLASSTLTLGGVAGSNTVTATLHGTSSSVTFNATGTVGSASILVFTTQPASSGTAGTVLSTQPVVKIEDINGNIITTSSASTTLSLYTDSSCSTAAPTAPSGVGSLGGTLTVSASSGVVSFSGIIPKKSGTTLYLKAASGALTSACSSVMNIAADAFSLSQSTLAVSSATVNSGSSITATLTAKDQFGNGNPSGVTAVTYSSTFVGGTGTFGSTTNAGSGVYTSSFTGSTSGSVTLSGLINASAISQTQSVTVNPGSISSLSFTTAPSLTGDTDTILSTQPVVTGKDAAGNTVTSYVTPITLTAYSDTSCTTLVSGGITATANPKTSVSGVASFSGVKILKTNVQSIQASDGTRSVCKATFNISAGAASTIAVSSGTPQSGTVGAALGSSLVAIVKDANLNVVSGITVDWAVTAGGGTLGAASNSTDGSGLSTNIYTLGTTAGTNTVTATIHGTATSTSFTSTGVAGFAAKLIFTTEPSSTGTAGTTLTTQPVVTVEDANGNTVTGSSASVVLALYSDNTCTTAVATAPSGVGSIGGTATVSAASGIATFSGISVKLAGTTLYFKASSGALTTDCSSAMNISPAAFSLSQSTLAVSSSTVNSGSSITATLTAKDAYANGNPSGVTAVTYSSTATAGTGSFGSTTNVGSGVYTASFTGTLSGATTLSGLINASTISQTQAVTVNSGSITHLTFTTSPSLTGDTDTNLSTQPVVSGKDAAGNTVTSYAGNVTLTGYSDTSCTTSVSSSVTATNNPKTAVSGDAAFAGTKILKTSVQSIKADDGTYSVCKATFSISAGAASTIAVSTGNTQSGTAGSALGSSLVAIVKDANANVVSGATIDWAVASGGGTLGSSSSTTNGSGLASNTLTLGNSSGANSVTATIHGTATSVTFTATGTAGSSSKLAFTTQPSTTGTSGTALSTQPIVTVQDSNGNTVTGSSASVVLALYSDNTCTTAAATAPSGAGSLGGTTTVSASSGVTTFSGVSVDKAGSTLYLRASSGVLTTACSTAINVSSGAFSLSQSTLAVSSATVTSGSTLTVTLTAKDAAGNSNPTGVTTVTYSTTFVGGTGTFGGTTNVGSGVYTSVFTATTSGSATLSGLINASTITSTQGITINAGSVSKIAFSTSPSLSGDTDTNLSTQPVVSGEDAAGNVVSTYTGSITLTAYSDTGCTTSVASGITATSNPKTAVSGNAAFSGVKILKTNVQSILASDGTYTVCKNTFSISAGAASTIAVNSGSGLSGTVHAALGSSLVAIVKDANANNVNGATIDWAVTGGGGTLGSASSTSNSSGLASNTLTLGDTAGANTVTATIHGTATSTTFSETGTAGAATQIAVSTGDTQSGTAGSPLPAFIKVLVSDAYNNAVASGVSVTWTVLTGGGSVTATSTTNSSGVAQATWTLGNTAGANTAKGALTSNAAVLANFSATGTAGAATQITITSGTPQSAYLGAALGSAMAVNVQDANNNNVGSYTIDWATSNGTLGSGASTTTAANGNTSNTLTLGTGSTAGGAQTVSATIHGTGTSVTFNITANVAAPTGLAGTNADAGSSLTWTATTGATSYKIYKTTTSGSGYTSPGTSLTNAYSASSLTNGTTYYFAVTALNNGVESAKSSETTVLPVVAPGAPTSLAGTLASQQTVLTWVAPATGTGPFTYKVYRSTTSGSGYSLVTTTGSGVVTYTDTGLTNGTTYYYAVKTSNGSVAGDSAYSSEIAITPDYVPTLAYDFTNASSFQPQNLLTYSQDLTNSWAASGVTITKNAAIAPDGTFTGNLMTESSGGGVHSLHQDTVKSATAQSYTFSVYAKPAGRTWARIDLWDGGSLGTRVWFNLSGSGSVGSTVNIGSGFTSVITSIQIVQNSWYRISFSATSSTATGMDAYIYPSTADNVQSWSGDGTSGIYLWGAQLEQNPGISRYVATTSAASTSFSSPLSPTYGSTSLSFTRSDTAAVATVYGSDGYLRRAPHNLLLYSQALDNSSVWSPGCTGTPMSITADSGVAPDGTTSAELFQNVDTAGNCDRLVHIPSSLSALNISGRTFVGSIWLKAGSAGDIGKNIQLQVKRNSGTYIGTINIVALTNSWQRISTSLTGISDTVGVRFVLTSLGTGGTNASSFYAWGAQLEENLSPSSYLPTTSAARYDGPRYDYDPVTLAPRGLLTEESRANLALASQLVSNTSYWGNPQYSFGATTTAPDGGTAPLVIPAANTTSKSVYQSVTVTAASYTASVYAKAGGYNWLGLGFGSAAINDGAFFNVSTCTVGTVKSGTTAKAINVGNGWCRVTVTRTQVAGTGYIQFEVYNADNLNSTWATPDGTSGVYVWGAQMELGSFATSLMPTTTATVTRAAENPSVPSPGTFLNVNEGTLFTESLPTGLAFGDGAGNRSTIRLAGPGSPNTTFAIRERRGNPDVFAMQRGPSTGDTNGTSISGTVSYKAAQVYKANDAAFSVSGSIRGTDSTYSGQDLSAPLLYVGTYDTTPYCGHIKQARYYNSRLPNADLNRITQ